MYIEIILYRTGLIPTWVCTRGSPPTIRASAPGGRRALVFLPGGARFSSPPNRSLVFLPTQPLPGFPPHVARFSSPTNRSLVFSDAVSISQSPAPLPGTVEADPFLPGTSRDRLRPCDPGPSARRREDRASLVSPSPCSLRAERRALRWMPSFAEYVASTVAGTCVPVSGVQHAFEPICFLHPVTQVQTKSGIQNSSCLHYGLGQPRCFCLSPSWPQLQLRAEVPSSLPFRQRAHLQVP